MRYIKFLYLLCFVLSVCRCTNEKYKEQPKPCVIVEEISFRDAIQPVFSKNCAISGCHISNNPQGNLNLEASFSYEQLNKKGRGYIDTTAPRNSVLYSSLVSLSQPMPPNGRLSDCDLKLIETWMKQGGKNN